VSERPTAMYDDLALAPDPTFDVALRRQLEARLQDRRSRATPGVIDIEFDVDMPLSAGPGPSRQVERGRSRRAVFAVAAAIVASMAAGVIVDELMIDDSSEPPALTVPAPTLPPATIPVTTTAPPTTTTELSFASDDSAATKTLLGSADYDIAGFSPLASWLPVSLDGSVAEQLPSCQQFAATVFESDNRPALIDSRIFQNDDGPWPYLMVQYVAVLPSVAQAAAMLDGMQESAFLAECVPAYGATLPPCCDDMKNWFPIYAAEDLEPPSIATAADDVWVRRYRGGSVTDGQGVVHDKPSEFAFAAVRVGRIVATIDVVLIDLDGRRVATVDDFERIVQRMADRAADAQAVS
jgi:hypothetical protein